MSTWCPSLTSYGTFIYGHAVDGAKLRAMRADPHVCFEVEHVDNLANWQSVIGWGTFEELDGEDAEVGMHLLVDRLMPLVGKQHQRKSARRGRRGIRRSSCNGLPDPVERKNRAVRKELSQLRSARHDSSCHQMKRPKSPLARADM